MSEGYVNHKRTYIIIFITLAVLTAIEVWIPGNMRTEPDPFRSLGLTPDRAALLALAVAKASLVALFFMHLRWETKWLRFVALAPATLVFYAVFLIAESIYR